MTHEYKNYILIKKIIGVFFIVHFIYYCIMIDFLKYTFLTNFGRLLLGAFIMIIGSFVYNYTENLTILYVGLTVFFAQTIVMFIFMIINLFYDYYGKR